MIKHIIDSCLGEARKYNEHSGQIAYDCPECSAESGKPQGDGKGNLEVNIKKNVYKCWVCYETNDTHGSLTKLIKKYGNSDLLDEYRIFRPSSYAKEVKKDVLNGLPEEYLPLNVKPSQFCTYYNQAIKYLKERNITDEIITKFNLGYAKEGKYRGRIIAPSYDSYGAVNYYVTRAFNNNKFKYLNPDVDKSTFIFNEPLISWDSTIYLVEGVFDHFVVPNSIPLLGKFISEKTYNSLLEKANANIVILLDDDAYADAINLYKKLNVGKLYSKIRIIQMPKGYDISLVNQKYGKRGVNKILRSRKRLNEPII